jgi:cation:H+ antiporter
LHVPDFVIGLTMVAFGTSAAELFVNIFASIEAKPNIVFGNVLGSNIFNVFVILGLSALFNPLSVGRGTVWKEIPFTFAAAAAFLVLANDALWTGGPDAISRFDGALLLVFFLAFMIYINAVAREFQKNNIAAKRHEHGMPATLGLIAIGLVALILGSKLVVNGATRLALLFGVSDALIALTIVSAGTSLPELCTSVVAAAKKNADIAVGNIIGSNIFNLLLILGISAVIRPQPYDTAFNADAIVGLSGCVLAFIFMFTWRKGVFDRIEGAIFLASYLMYFGFLIQRG